MPILWEETCMISFPRQGLESHCQTRVWATTTLWSRIKSTLLCQTRKRVPYLKNNVVVLGIVWQGIEYRSHTCEQMIAVTCFSFATLSARAWSVLLVRSLFLETSLDGSCSCEQILEIVHSDRSCWIRRLGRRRTRSIEVDESFED